METPSEPVDILVDVKAVIGYIMQHHAREKAAR